MRRIGSLNLSLGLVNIEMGINSFLDYTGISFNQLCPMCVSKVKYNRVCSNKECDNNEKDIPYSDLKKGYYLGKGLGFKVVPKDVFEQLENFDTRIVTVIPHNSCPIFLSQKTYILTPLKTRKPYFLLRDILIDMNVDLIVEYSFRKNIKLGLIKVSKFKGNAYLMLYNILYSDKMKPIEELKEETVSKDELKLGLDLFQKIVDSLPKENFMELKDRRRIIIENLLEGKVKPKEVIKETKKAKSLVENLKKSLEEKKKKKKKGVKA